MVGDRSGDVGASSRGIATELGVVEALVLRQRFPEAADLVERMMERLTATSGELDEASARLVLVALEQAGRFALAIEWLRSVPALAVDRAVDLVRIEEHARMFDPMKSAALSAGPVRSIDGIREIRVGPDRLIVDPCGGRVDVGLIDHAVARMRRKHGPAWGGVGPIDVEVYMDADRFTERVSSSTGLDPGRARRMLACAVWLGGRDGAHLAVVRVDGMVGLPAMHVHQKLRHEYIHLAVRQLARGGPVPAWLDEGLAMALTMGLPRRLLGAARTPRETDLLGWTPGLPEGDVELDAALGGSHAATAALLARLGEQGVATGLFERRAASFWIAEAISALGNGTEPGPLRQREPGASQGE